MKITPDQVLKTIAIGNAAALFGQVEAGLLIVLPATLIAAFHVAKQMTRARSPRLLDARRGA